VNSEDYCNIKGVSYGKLVLEDMGQQSTPANAALLGTGPPVVFSDYVPLQSYLGAGSSQIKTGYPLPSCYVSTGESLLQDLFGDTLVRWIASGGFVNSVNFAGQALGNYMGVAANELHNISNELGSIRPFTNPYTPVKAPTLPPAPVLNAPTIPNVTLPPPPNASDIHLSATTVNIYDPALNTAINTVTGAGATLLNSSVNGAITGYNTVINAGASIVSSDINSGIQVLNYGTASGVTAVNAVTAGAVGLTNDVTHAGVTAANQVANGVLNYLQVLEWAGLQEASMITGGLSSGFDVVSGGLESLFT
jgi:hypothetical protein